MFKRVDKTTSCCLREETSSDGALLRDMLVGRGSVWLIALQPHLLHHWHLCCRPSQIVLKCPCSVLDNTSTDELFLYNCNKPFVVDRNADLEVLKRWKKQTHLGVLFFIHPATDLYLRWWAEFEMTTQHDELLRRFYRAFQILKLLQQADSL